MKILNRIFLLASLVLLANFAMAQRNLTLSISGHLYRPGTTLTIPNHPVQAIWLDSMSVPVNGQIVNTTTTNANGEYSFSFTFPFTTFTPTRPVLVSTIDCQNLTRSSRVLLTQSNVVQNFYICNNDTLTPPPCALSAGIGLDSIGSNPFERHFRSLVRGNYSSLLWSFGDSGTSTEANPIHVFNGPGTYRVTLTVIQSATCSFTTTQLVDVSGGINPCTLRAGFTTALLQGNPVSRSYQFTNTTTTSPSSRLTYTWSFGDGTISNEVSPIHTYITDGTYRVSLVATDPITGCTNTKFISLAVGNTVPCNIFASFRSEPVRTIPGGIRFINTSLAFPNVVYNWSFGDNQYSTDANPLHTYAANGRYAITLIAFVDSGCVSTYVDSVFVTNAGSGIPCSVTAGFTYTVNGNIVSFNNTSSGNASFYRWTFGDGTLSNDFNATHTFANSGIYTVTLTAVGDSGCLSNATQTIVIRNGRNYSLTGLISSGGRLINARVVLFGIYRNFRVVCRTLDASNTYRFDNVPEGNYIIRAYPADTSWTTRPMPTYFGNTVDWSNATVIRVDSSLSPSAAFPISLVPTNDSMRTNHTHFIHGIVSRRDSINATGRVSSYNVSFSLEDVAVMLMDINGNVVGAAMPNANGSYRMPMPAANGSYFIAAQYPKVTMTPLQMVISDVNTNMTADFISTSSTITGITKSVVSSSLKLAPVPATSQLSVSTPYDIVSLSISSISGSAISFPYTITDSQNAKLQLDGLAPGVYMLQVTTTAGTGVSRFVKQ